MRQTEVSDITSKFEDVNAYDRIYRCQRGHVVKVRVTDRSASPASLIFEVTGSWADEATGKARWFDTASLFLVAPHELVIRSETETDVGGEVEAARLVMVERVSLAAANHTARQALQGIRANPQTVN